MGLDRRQRGFGEGAVGWAADEMHGQIARGLWLAGLGQQGGMRFPATGMNDDIACNGGAGGGAGAQN